MNIKATINKLQKALIHRGYIYKINTYQFYGDQQNRMITGYRITQKQQEKNKIVCKAEISYLEKYKTAYDVEKVVARLEEESYQHFGGSRSVDLNFAIETVRAGTGQ